MTHLLIRPLNPSCSVRDTVHQDQSIQAALIQQLKVVEIFAALYKAYFKNQSYIATISTPRRQRKMQDMLKNDALSEILTKVRVNKEWKE